MSIVQLLDLTLIAILLLASGFDLHRRKIPNLLLVFGLSAALIINLAMSSPLRIFTVYIAGFAVGLAMFLPLYLKGGMAAGDVKLMATVGSFLGPHMALECSLMTYCAGGILALGIVIKRGAWYRALSNVLSILYPLLLRFQGVRLNVDSHKIQSVGTMPYALAITGGTCAVLWLRHT